MRELKMKIWDTKDKRWMTPMIEDVEERELRVTVQGDILYRPSLEERIKMNDGFVCGNDRFKIVQYTGAKDIKKKEIYEGHKVQGFERFGTEQIEGIIKWNELEIDYQLVVDGVYTGISVRDIYKIEIIGHMFEDKE